MFRLIVAFGKTPLTNRVLKALDGLDELSPDEKRSKLAYLYKLVWATIHPDKVHGEEKKEKAEEICKKHGEGLKEMSKKLSGATAKNNLVLSDEKYLEIIKLMKLYEEESKSRFIPSFIHTQTRSWRKLRAKASDFAEGVSKKDLADIQEVLEYKRNGKEVPKSFRMAYYKRKNAEYFDLITTELEIIDNYLYSMVTKGGSKLYKSIKWINLQKLLEERVEHLETIQTYVVGDAPNGNTRLKHKESLMYYYQTTGLYSMIGFFVFLAVMTWLKERMIEYLKRNRPSKYDDEFDDDSLFTDYNSDDFEDFDE